MVECRMPFRILVSLVLLGLLFAAALILPLVWPVPPLADTRGVDELAGPDATWIEADGVRLHARIAAPADVHDGDAPAAFVFVHAYASQLGTFARLQDALSTTAPTIAYDRPGFGLSERPPASGGNPGPYGHEAQVEHLRVALDALGARRGVIVGAGAGGSIALRFAHRHPERVAGLVLIAPDVEGGGGVAPVARPLLRTPQADRIGPLLMRQLGGEAGESLLRAAYADESRLPAETLEAHRRATSAHGWDRALWEVTRAGRAPDVAPRLGAIDAPALLLTGSEDTVVPPDATERVARQLPDARLEVVDGCGHRVHEECPDAAIAAVEAWLERSAAEEGPPPRAAGVRR